MRLHLHSRKNSDHGAGDDSKLEGSGASTPSQHKRHHYGRLSLRKLRSASDASAEDSRHSIASEPHSPRRASLIKRISGGRHGSHRGTPSTASKETSTHSEQQQQSPRKHWWQHALHAVEEAFRSNSVAMKYQPAVHVRRGHLLRGCSTSEEHYAKSKETVEKARQGYGAEGLRAIGFEYRMVLCDEHRPQLYDTSVILEEDEEEGLDLHGAALVLPTVASAPDMQHTDVTSTASASALSNDTQLDLPVSIPPPVSDSEHCHLCMHRLYHIESDTCIDTENRRSFVADGDMYDAIAKLCQDAAHEAMCREAQLEWVTIEDDVEDGKEAIRALVNTDHPLIRSASQRNVTNISNKPSNEPPHRPTLMIATGKGKVRAGIFSRQHLMCTSMESSTALPIVREAVSRNLSIVMIDPNVHGDRNGYETFRKTMEGLFARWEDDDASTSSVPLQSRDLYILSHSASGGQLARYLLDRSDAYLPHIRAIAFTDSTHNIQWCKTGENEGLYNLLESPEAVYFKCATVRNNEDASRWYLHPAGEEVKTDTFWQRRFGKIRTYWAGTNEHSLTNWYAHSKIWEHFDAYLHPPAHRDLPLATTEQDEPNERKESKEGNLGEILQ